MTRFRASVPIHGQSTITHPDGITFELNMVHGEANTHRQKIFEIGSTIWPNRYVIGMYTRGPIGHLVFSRCVGLEGA